MNVYVYICVYVCMYVYMYVCMYLYICMNVFMLHIYNMEPKTVGIFEGRSIKILI